MTIIYNEKIFKKIKISTWFFISTFIIGIIQYVLLIIHMNIDIEKIQDILIYTNLALAALYKVFFLVSAMIYFEILYKIEGKKDNFFIISIYC